MHGLGSPRASLAGDQRTRFTWVRGPSLLQRPTLPHALHQKPHATAARSPASQHPRTREEPPWLFQSFYGEAFLIKELRQTVRAGQVSRANGDERIALHEHGKRAVSHAATSKVKQALQECGRRPCLV